MRIGDLARALPKADELGFTSEDLARVQTNAFEVAHITESERARVLDEIRALVALPREARA